MASLMTGLFSTAGFHARSFGMQRDEVKTPLGQQTVREARTMEKKNKGVLLHTPLNRLLYEKV
jgi:hypothetical protein